MVFVFVSAGLGQLEQRGFRKYFYANQEVVVEPTRTEFGEAAIVSSLDARLGQDLSDRFSSGMFGTRVFTDLDEAKEFLKDY